MNDPGLKAKSFSVKPDGNPLAFSLVLDQLHNAIVDRRAAINSHTALPRLRPEPNSFENLWQGGDGKKSRPGLG